MTATEIEEPAEPPATHPRHRGGRAHGRRRRSDGPRFRGILLSTFAAFVVLGTLWSLAQPPLSGGDEIEHLNMGQAVWSGQFVPRLIDGGAQFKSGMVKVRSPQTRVLCYVGKPRKSAKCDTLAYRHGEPLAVVADYVSREPILPAILTGLPSALDAGRLGLYLSRELNVVIVAAGIAIAVALALSRRRPILGLAVVLGTTPAAVAEGGTLGASQLEIAAASVLWVAVALLIDGEAPTPRFLALTGITAAVLAEARPISWGFVGLAGVVLLVGLGVRQRAALLRARAFKVVLAVVALAVIVALAWYVFVTAPINPLWDGLNHLPLVTNISPRIGIPLGQSATYWEQMIAGIGFAFYDGPWWVVLGWSLLIGATVVFGWLFAHARVRIAMAIVAVTFVVLPIASQAVTLSKTYLYWQGRYSVPLLLGGLTLAALPLGAQIRRLPELGRWATGAVVAAGVLSMMSFYGSLRRYAVGTLATYDPFSWSSGWHPPIPAPLLLLLGLVVTGGTYALLALHHRRASLGQDPTDEGGATAGGPGADSPGAGITVNPTGAGGAPTLR